MSLLDHGCEMCADEFAVFDTHGSCPICGRSDPREEPEPLERVRVVHASDEWPGFSKRGNPRDPTPPEDDRRTT